MSGNHRNIEGEVHPGTGTEPGYTEMADLESHASAPSDSPISQGLLHREQQNSPPPPPYNLYARAAQVAQGPIAATAAKKIDQHLLPTVFVPMLFAMADYLYDELQKTHAELQACNHQGDPDYDPSKTNKATWIYFLLVASQLIFVLYHLAKAASNMFSATHNHLHALVTSGIINQHQMNEMTSVTASHTFAKAVRLATPVCMATSAVYFSHAQFQSGIFSAVVAMGSFVLSALLTSKEGKSNYKMLTGQRYQQTMTTAQERAVFGGFLTTLGGGLGLVFIAHDLSDALKNGGENPHIAGILGCIGTMLAGASIVGTYFSMRGVDAMQAAIESKAQGVYSNHAQMSRFLVFGKKVDVRRDLKNIGLGSIESILLSAMAVGFSLKVDQVPALLPFLAAAVGLTAVSHYTSSSYADDLNAVSHRLNHPESRIARLDREAELVDDEGGCLEKIKAYIPCFRSR
jgi:hypothetical protein